MISQADVRTILDFYKGNLIVQSEDEFDNPLNDIVGMLPYVNLLREICAVIKEYNETVEEAEEFIEDKTRNYESELFCVNVKRYADYIDLEEILDKMNVSDKEKEYIKDNIDIDNMYEYWLEDCRRDIVDNFMKGCCTEKEEKESRYLELFENAGFYGKGGGWFGVQLSDKLENDFDILGNLSLDEPIENASYFEGYGLRDIRCIREVTENMKHKMEAVEWLLDYVKNYNNTLNFEEELKYRVGEMREEYKNG